MEQAVGEIVEVVQALAQVGVGLAQHPGAVVGLHPLHRRLRGQAGGHRLAHAPEPALVVGEHAEGLQNLPVLPVMGHVAALDQLVDGGAHLADGRIEALDLRVHVLGDEVLDHHPRLVETTWPRPTPPPGKCPSGRAGGAAQCRSHRGQRLKLACGDHLGQHHGGGLERLHLLFRIDR
jgi:hypothetical protein